MKRLKRAASKFGLRGKASQQSSSSSSDFVLTPEERSIIERHTKEQINRRPVPAPPKHSTVNTMSSRVLPGGPPDIFDEWAGEWQKDTNLFQPSSTSGGNGATYTARDSSPPRSIYGDFELPLFGPQYGMSTTPKPEDMPTRNPVVMRVDASSSPSYEDMMRSADRELEMVLQESLKTAEEERRRMTPEPDASRDPYGTDFKNYSTPSPAPGLHTPLDTLGSWAQHSPLIPPVVVRTPTPPATTFDFSRFGRTAPSPHPRSPRTRSRRTPPTDPAVSAPFRIPRPAPPASTQRPPSPLPGSFPSDDDDTFIPDPTLYTPLPPARSPPPPPPAAPPTQLPKEQIPPEFLTTEERAELQRAEQMRTLQSLDVRTSPPTGPYPTPSRYMPPSRSSPNRAELLRAEQMRTLAPQTDPTPTSPQTTGPSASTSPSRYNPPSPSSPTSCIICTDDFTPSKRPPAWISLACLHEPGVDEECLQEYLRSELESKMWNKLKCPECSAGLIWDDVRRLADEGTFARYETMSFRAAVGSDENFVWCRSCSFGQLHDSGATQPIVRCLNCGARSCFTHQGIPWHERLTCEEYDAMVADPDGFQSQRDREDEEAARERERQLEDDERLAREMDSRDRAREVERQEAAHAEARRKQEEEQRVEKERKIKEAERKKVEKEKAEKLREIKRKKAEEDATLETIEKTTKKCPKCTWPIEKNEGCDHMTCTQCHAEFCWLCMAEYNAIRKHGNSHHAESCRFHTNNLPAYVEPT